MEVVTQALPSEEQQHPPRYDNPRHACHARAAGGFSKLASGRSPQLCRSMLFPVRPGRMRAALLQPSGGGGPGRDVPEGGGGFAPGVSKLGYPFPHGLLRHCASRKEKAALRVLGDVPGIAAAGGGAWARVACRCWACGEAKEIFFEKRGVEQRMM